MSIIDLNDDLVAKIIKAACLDMKDLVEIAFSSKRTIQMGLLSNLSSMKFDYGDQRFRSLSHFFRFMENCLAINPRVSELIIKIKVINPKLLPDSVSRTLDLLGSVELRDLDIDLKPFKSVLLKSSDFDYLITLKIKSSSYFFDSIEFLFSVNKPTMIYLQDLDLSKVLLKPNTAEKALVVCLPSLVMIRFLNCDHTVLKRIHLVAPNLKKIHLLNLIEGHEKLNCVFELTSNCVSTLELRGGMYSEYHFGDVDIECAHIQILGMFSTTSQIRCLIKGLKKVKYLEFESKNVEIQELDDDTCRFTRLERVVLSGTPKPSYIYKLLMPETIIVDLCRG